MIYRRFPGTPGRTRGCIMSNRLELFTKEMPWPMGRRRCGGDQKNLTRENNPKTFQLVHVPLSLSLFKTPLATTGARFVREHCDFRRFQQNYEEKWMCFSPKHRSRITRVRCKSGAVRVSARCYTTSDVHI